MAITRKDKIPDDVKTRPVSENRDPITGERQQRFQPQLPNSMCGA